MSGSKAVSGHVAFSPDRVDRCIIDHKPTGGDADGGFFSSSFEGPFRMREP